MKRLLLVPAIVALALSGVAVADAVSPPTTPTLTAVEASHHGAFDRVVFDFRGGIPEQRNFSYVPQLVSDPKGDVIPVPGGAILLARFFHGTSAIGPIQVFNLPNVIEVVRAGDFEGVLRAGIVEERSAAFHVVANPGQGTVTVDIDTPSGPPTAPPAVPVTRRPHFTG